MWGMRINDENILLLPFVCSSIIFPTSTYSSPTVCQALSKPFAGDRHPSVFVNEQPESTLSPGPCMSDRFLCWATGSFCETMCQSVMCCFLTGANPFLPSLHGGNIFNIRILLNSLNCLQCILFFS